MWSERGFRPLRGRKFGLSAYKLVGVVGLFEALTAQVVVPHFGESLVLGVEVGKLHILAAYKVPAPLLYAYEIVSVVVGIEFAVSKLETHLGIAHEVAILFAVMRDRDSG